MPRFSIIIPAYNVEPYISECLDSVLNQQFSDYEIILINDGSTDNTPDICLKYAGKDKRIRYYSKENGGLSHTRNYGIDRADGEYVFFLDSDDMIEEDALLYLNEIIEKDDPDVVVTRYRILDNITKELKNTSDFPETVLNNKGMSVAQKYEQCYLYNDISPTATLTVPRLKYLNDHGLRFLNGILHEDELWTPQVFLNAKKLSFCTASCYQYRINRDGAITNKVKEINLRDKIRVMDELSVLSKMNSSSSEISKCYNERAACMYAWFIKYHEEVKNYNEIADLLHERTYILKDASQFKYKLLGYAVKILGVKDALSLFSMLAG